MYICIYIERNISMSTYICTERGKMMHVCISVYIYIYTRIYTYCLLYLLLCCRVVCCWSVCRCWLPVAVLRTHLRCSISPSPVATDVASNVTLASKSWLMGLQFSKLLTFFCELMMLAYLVMKLLILRLGSNAMIKYHVRANRFLANTILLSISTTKLGSLAILSSLVAPDVTWTLRMHRYMFAPASFLQSCVRLCTWVSSCMSCVWHGWGCSGLLRTGLLPHLLRCRNLQCCKFCASVYIYIYTYIYISLSLYIYIYICIHIYIYV